MRILLLTSYFPPDTGSAAHLFFELGRELARREHSVTVITSMPGYHAQGPMDRYRHRLWVREQMEGMTVLRTCVPSFARESRLGRGLWQFGSAAGCFLAGLCQKRADAAIVYSPPLPLALAAWALKGFRGTPFVLNVQDLFPQSAIDLGLLRNSWLVRFLRALERFLYSRAAHITVHSPGNRQFIIDRGEPKARVTVFPNWVDTGFLCPGKRANSFRTDHRLDSSFLVTFGGVLGRSQDLDVVLESARRLQSKPDIRFLVIGDGVEKARLEHRTAEMALRNVRFLPMQPRQRYSALMHASDVCLVTLRAEVRTPVLPSKILSAMAAGRPVVAALDPQGDAARLIRDAGCGLSVPPGDAEALAGAIAQLYVDAGLRQRMGGNGRAYAVEHLSLTASVGRYEALLDGIVRPGLPRQTPARCASSLRPLVREEK